MMNHTYASLSILEPHEFLWHGKVTDWIFVEKYEKRAGSILPALSYQAISWS